jgi:hypothetical protein
MATLKDIRDFVKRNMDYQPTSTDFDKTLNQIINVQYMDIFTAKPYNFSQREVKLQVYKDVAKSATAGGTSSSPTITLSSGEWPTWAEGQVAEMTVGGVTVENEFTYRQNATIGYYQGEFLGSGAATITLKNRYIDLPEDCVDVLNVSRRTNNLTSNNVGQYVAISRYEDEWHNLPLDDTGTPSYWVYTDDYYLDSPRYITATGTTSGSGNGVRTIEVACAFAYRGANTDDYGIRYSGLSAPVTVSLTDTQVLNVQIGNAYSAKGLYKVVCFKSESNGWNNWRILDLGNASALNENYNLRLTELQSNDVQVNYTKFPESGGATKRIRLYLRQEEDYDLSVRYVYRPQQLNEDQDTVEIPSSHAIYAIGYAVLENMAMNTDNDSRAVYYQRKKEQVLQELDSHFLTSIARRYIKDYMSNRRMAPLYTKLTRNP